MHLGTSLDEAFDRVKADDCGKWDALVPASSLSLQNGHLTFPEAQHDGFDGGLTLSTWAQAQACQKLGIPAAYFKKCPPDLQDYQFNHWIGAETGAEAVWLIRTKGAAVRGVLSQRYSRLDNRDLLTALYPILKDNPYQVGLCQITPEAFHLRLVSPGLFRDVRAGDRLYAGIHLANSEVGFRAVTVEALVYRLVCTNGLIRRVNSQSLFKQRHAFLAPALFQEKLRDAVGQAAVVAAGFLEQITLAAALQVRQPDQAVSILVAAWSLSKTTEELIRFCLAGEQGYDSLYGLVNAITAAAQRLSVEERYALEVQAGQLIDGAGPSALLRRRILDEEGEERWQLTKAA